MARELHGAKGGRGFAAGPAAGGKRDRGGERVVARVAEQGEELVMRVGLDGA